MSKDHYHYFTLALQTAWIDVKRDKSPQRLSCKGMAPDVGAVFAELAAAAWLPIHLAVAGAVLRYEEIRPANELPVEHWSAIVSACKSIIEVHEKSFKR